MTNSLALARNALAKIQAHYIKTERLTHYLALQDKDRMGGQRARYLREHVLYRASNGKCVCCLQDVALGVPAEHANAMTCGILIPCAMIEIGSRAGMAPGNCASFCRACVDASNDANANGRVFIWTADTVDARLVPTVWPPIPKLKAHAYPAPKNVNLIEYRRRAALARTRRGIIA